MNSEIINIVDDQDRVIGQETISESIRRGFNRRIAHVWVFDPNGRLLVCQRPLTVHSYPGKWTSSAGGYVTAGESYEMAAWRELREELGIAVFLQHAFVLKHLHSRGHFMFVDLWFGTLRDEKLKFDPEEIMNTLFIPIKDLEKWISEKPEDFNPEFIQLVKLWNEKIP